MSTVNFVVVALYLCDCFKVIVHELTLPGLDTFPSMPKVLFIGVDYAVAVRCVTAVLARVECLWECLFLYVSSLQPLAVAASPRY